MNCRKISLIMAAIVIVVIPSAVHADQILPNPNTGTITVTDPNAYNSANPFDNNGDIEITAAGTLNNNSGGTLENYGALSNNGTLNNNPGGTLNNYGSLNNNATLQQRHAKQLLRRHAP